MHVKCNSINPDDTYNTIVQAQAHMYNTTLPTGEDEGSRTLVYTFLRFMPTLHSTGLRKKPSRVSSYRKFN